MASALGKDFWRGVRLFSESHPENYKEFLVLSQVHFIPQTTRRVAIPSLLYLYSLYALAVLIVNSFMMFLRRF